MKGPARIARRETPYPVQGLADGETLDILDSNTAVIWGAISMNGLQRKILVGGIGLAVILCLFPPWVFTAQNPRGGAELSERPGPWACAFVPPTSRDIENSPMWYGVKMDIARLGLELFGVAGLVGVGLLLAHRRQTNRGQA
jgi:hypothetical protein